MNDQKDTSSLHASITPELAEFVENLVESGRYSSRSEAVRAALRLLEDQERLREMKLESLKEKIQEGLESGEAEEWNMEELKEATRAELEDPLVDKNK